MKVNDFLKHINKNQRSKLVDFLKSCDSRNTKLELVSGQLADTSQNDAGTLSLAICYQHIHSNGDRTWDFIVATDTMATKDKEEAFTYIRIIYPLFPCLAEEVYMELFNGKYSILNEGWPS
jgi:leucyl-tRNA synthetase